MISEVGVAAILLNHLTKGTKEGGKAIYRSNGSIAYVAICRSAWIVTKDPQDNTGHRRLWLPTKNNMAKDHGIGLAYTIEGKTLAIEDEISSQPVVVWQGRLRDFSRRSRSHAREGGRSPTGECGELAE